MHTVNVPKEAQQHICAGCTSSTGLQTDLYSASFALKSHLTLDNPAYAGVIGNCPQSLLAKEAFVKYLWRAQTLLTLLLALLVVVACSGGGDGDTPTNRPPTVTLTLNPASGQVPLNVTTTADASDPDGDTLSFLWQVDGQENAETGSELRLVFEQPGTYPIRVTVSDGSAQASANQTVTVTEAAGTDTVVTGFVSEQSRNVVVILTSDDDDEDEQADAPNVNKINQAVSSMLTGKLGTQAETQPVVRGVNAYVMNAIFSQQEDANTLFNFAGKDVVATKASGEVVSSGAIGRDGSFDVPLTECPTTRPASIFCGRTKRRRRVEVH